MYFDPEPKSNKKDFFNYGYEYALIKKSLHGKSKIIAVIGVRRVGKTSLLNVVYHETTTLKVWLDGRIVSDPKKEIFSAIYEVARTGKPKIFGKIESLNVSAFGIGVGIKIGPESQVELERKIRDSGQICVFIDEAQRMKGNELADVLSYFYDRFPKVVFIISGSEVGLVGDILGEEDSEHSLYGRNIVKIPMERLDKNEGMEFLSKGFVQTGVVVSSGEIANAIETLDGLIGWLTLYGYERGIMKNANALSKTTETGARIAASELTHFFKKTRGKQLYLGILRNASGIRWSELKVRVEKELGRQLNPNSFTFALAKLMDYSFIEKKNGKYYLSDPLLLKATFIL